MYTITRESHKNTRLIGELFEHNHISNFPKEKWSELNPKYKLKKAAKDDIEKSQQHSIIAWADQRMGEDPKDIVIYINDEDGSLVWEPFIEMLMRQEVFNKGVTEYFEGYIAGKYSNFGAYASCETFDNSFEGYNFFQKYKISK